MRDPRSRTRRSNCNSPAWHHLARRSPTCTRRPSPCTDHWRTHHRPGPLRSTTAHTAQEDPTEERRALRFGLHTRYRRQRRGHRTFPNRPYEQSILNIIAVNIHAFPFLSKTFPENFYLCARIGAPVLPGVVSIEHGPASCTRCNSCIHPRGILRLNLIAAIRRKQHPRTNRAPQQLDAAGKVHAMRPRITLASPCTPVRRWLSPACM